MSNSGDKMQLIKDLIRPVAALFLPLLPAVTIALLVLSLLIAIVEGKVKTTDWNSQLRNPWLLFPVAFYLMHCLGLLWTENISFGLFDLQVKLSLMILPFLFAVNPAGKSEINRICNFYITGALVACVIMLVTAVYRFSLVPFKNYFFYIDLVKPLHFHPTYITVYIALAALLLLNQVTQKERTVSLIHIVPLFFFGLTIALLSAKMAELTFLVVLLILAILILSWFKNRKGFVVVLSFIAFCLVCDFVSKSFYNRFEAVEIALSKLDNKSPKDDLSSSESTDSRFRIWENGFILLKENWLTGTGTGDIKDEILKVHERTGFEAGVERRYGPHNQYLQSGSALGLAGLIILVLMFIIPLVLAYKSREIPAFLFLLMLGANLLAESMLEVQAGVLFTGFFYGLFSSAGKT